MNSFNPQNVPRETWLEETEVKEVLHMGGPDFGGSRDSAPCQHQQYEYGPPRSMVAVPPAEELAHGG